MKLLAYAILARPDNAFSLPQEIAGRAVRLVADGALAAAVSEVPAEPAVEAGQVLAFEAVVEWFHAHCPAVIPVRFGSVFPDEAAVAARLRRGAPEYLRLLSEVEGAVEVGIRVLADEPAPRPDEDAVSGTAWLEARRRRRLRLDGAAARLRSELGDTFRRSCQETGAGMLSIYFLVPRPNAAMFVERAAKLRIPGARLLVSGPWPPHNFTTAPEDLP